MAKDLDFWQNAKGEYETKIRNLAKQLEQLAESEGVEDYFEPVRLAYWLDYLQSEPMPSNGEELREAIDRESWAFYGDHESLGAAAEYFAEEFLGLSEEAVTHLVIDWAATWNYSFQYDFDSCEYTLAEEPNAEDFVQLPRFVGAGVWVWRNN